MDKTGTNILSQLNSLRLSDGTMAGERLRVGMTPPSIPATKAAFGVGAPKVSKGSTYTESSTAVRSGNTVRTAEPSAAHSLLLEKGILGRVSVEKKTLTYSPTEHSKGDKRGVGGYLCPDSDGHDNNNGAKGTRPSDMEKSKPNIITPKPRSSVETSSSAFIVESMNKRFNEAIKENEVESRQDLTPKIVQFVSSSDRKGSTQGISTLSAAKELQLLIDKRTGVSFSNEDDKLRSEKNPFSKSQGDGDQKEPCDIPLKIAPMTTTTLMPFTPAQSVTVEDHVRALKANQFVADALGGGHIDNDRSVKPIIRTLPNLPVGGRYIVVGDVHGCLDQLEALIKKVKYTPPKDCLVFLGDYVNKGPLSVKVIQACRNWRALGVLGNHDFTLINCCRQMRQKPFNDRDLRDPVKRLAAKLPLECEYYLRSLPHILRMPKYNVILVHAGLNVQNSLEEQNVYDIMHMRRLECVVPQDGEHQLEQSKTQYKAVIKGNEGVPWAEQWRGPELVVFGHDARSGFQHHPFAYGIDTGCVYGQRLTCVIFSEDTPQGEFFYVSGLPKHINNKMGMPPPDSPIYDEFEANLHRYLIRPSRRTVASAATQRTPLFYGSLPNQSFPCAAIASPSALLPGSLSVNQSMTPSFLTQQIADSPQKKRGDASGVVHKAGLLALARAGELRALAVLMNVAVYEEAVSAMLSNDLGNLEVQTSFWLPFSKSILEASLLLTTEVGTEAEGEDYAKVVDIVQYALGVCDEMAVVRECVVPELNALLTHANRLSKDDHKNLWKGITKYIESLLH